MTSKAVFIDTEAAQALEIAARYCNTLAAAERAYALEDEADLGAVLGGVDPTELPYIANVLQTIFMAWQVLPASPIGEEPQADVHRAHRLHVVSAESSLAAVPPQSSSPTSFSTKVPCE